MAQIESSKGRPGVKKLASELTSVHDDKRMNTGRGQTGYFSVLMSAADERRAAFSVMSYAVEDIRTK